MGFSIADRLFNQIYDKKLNATRSKCSKSHKIKLHIEHLVIKNSYTEFRFLKRRSQFVFQRWTKVLQVWKDM